MSTRDLSFSSLRAIILLFSFSILFAFPLRAMTGEEFDHEFTRQKLILDIYDELRELAKICGNRTVPNVDGVIHKLDSFVLAHEVRQALEMRVKGLNLDISCNLSLTEMEQLQEMLASMKSVVTDKQQSGSSLSMWVIAGISFGTVAVGSLAAFLLTREGQVPGQHHLGLNCQNYLGVQDRLRGHIQGGLHGSYGERDGRPFAYGQQVTFDVNLFKDAPDCKGEAVKLEQTCTAFVNELKMKEELFRRWLYENLILGSQSRQPDLWNECCMKRKNNNTPLTIDEFLKFANKVITRKCKEVRENNLDYYEVRESLERFRTTREKILRIKALLLAKLGGSSATFDYAQAHSLWKEVRELLIEAQKSQWYGQFHGCREVLEEIIIAFKNDLATHISSFAQADDEDEDDEEEE